MPTATRLSALRISFDHCCELVDELCISGQRRQHAQTQRTVVEACQARFNEKRAFELDSARQHELELGHGVVNASV